MESWASDLVVGELFVSAVITIIIFLVVWKIRFPKK
jgi:hypothetical protein